MAKHKQELFVQEYLIELNQTQAAICAEYSVKSGDTGDHQRCNSLAWSCSSST